MYNMYIEQIVWYLCVKIVLVFFFTGQFRLMCRVCVLVRSTQCYVHYFLLHTWS
jgi:hypothetical protein